LTTILLDTNAYLRLARRIKPLLATSPFNRFKEYHLVVLNEVRAEVQRNPRLKAKFPWFFDGDFMADREAKTLRFSAEERASVKAKEQFLLDWVSDNIAEFMSARRSPPGGADCRVLAAAMVRNAMVATDDEGMIHLAQEMGIPAMRCCDVLHKMWAAGRVEDAEVVAIYQALLRNSDLPVQWLIVRDTLFKRIRHRLTDEVLKES